MTIQTTTNGNQSTLYLCARFDFSHQADFRKAYESQPKNNSFILDFSKTNHMDSAALGMLLLLKDYAGGDRANIKLIKCQPEIKNIFKISNFGNVFKIS